MVKSNTHTGGLIVPKANMKNWMSLWKIKGSHWGLTSGTLTMRDEHKN